MHWNCQKVSLPELCWWPKIQLCIWDDNIAECWYRQVLDYHSYSCHHCLLNLIQSRLIKGPRKTAFNRLKSQIASKYTCQDCVGGLRLNYDFRMKTSQNNDTLIQTCFTVLLFWLSMSSLFHTYITGRKKSFKGKIIRSKAPWLQGCHRIYHYRFCQEPYLHLLLLPRLHYPATSPK